MNLAWLAAVLQPHDVALHPNFPDDEFDRSGPSRLAGLVIGDGWRTRRIAALAGDADDDDPVTLAAYCLDTDTIASGVGRLSSYLISGGASDLARGTALALMASSAAAELDDYPTCFRVLDVQINRVGDTKGPDETLLRAALLQQRALRLQDAGQPHVEGALEAGKVALAITPERCSSFPTGPGVSWVSLQTVEQMRDTLLEAAASLIPLGASERAHAIGLASRQEMTRGGVSALTVRTARSKAEVYSKYVSRQFSTQYGRRSSTFGETSGPDLFRSVLAYELAGHAAVYGARKELALLRLVQADAEDVDLADALRLLRHAAAKRELDLTLGRLRSAGPLSVLSRDARQILRTRTAPEMLRTVELRVLRQAADLLAPPEARVALDAVRAGLEAGGPPDLPGEWELLVLRKEVAWQAAVALANVCAAAAEVAELLLEEARQVTEYDQLFDQALMRAAAEVEWAIVPQELHAAWEQLLNDRSSEGILPATTEIVLARMGRSIPAAISDTPVERVIHELNTAIRGGKEIVAVDAESRQQVREALVRIRSDASRGSYSFGGHSDADVAAGLIIYAGADDLWEEVTGFLLDPAVSRDDRTPAFERLARADLALPDDAVVRFRQHASQVLAGATSDLFEAPLTPYPAALRFLAAHQLIGATRAYDEVSILAGASGAEGRREAAITIGVLAQRGLSPELLALALSLSHDDTAEVRASCARALAVLASSDAPLATVAQRRLSELIEEDGVLVPSQVLRSLADLPTPLTEPVALQVQDLSRQHPARSVRQDASRVLKSLSELPE